MEDKQNHATFDKNQRQDDDINLPEKRALSLIYYNEKTGFEVSDEAVEFLSSIKEKVGVIVVAGKYRTGKSFLLNRVILNRIGEGFGVGPTINPCTKGLWVWNEIVETEYNGENLKVVIIDSEGIGAFDEDQNHDTKIFLFALLLSSFFIYNSMGTIDENAITNLSLIINLSKSLHIQSDSANEEDPDELAKYFPKFLWVLRDFSLKLYDEYDNPLTAKDYFENALNPQKGNNSKIEARNRIRRLIKTFFTDRDCFTLVRPTEEETDLQSLQSLPDDKLRPEFVEASKRLRSKIFKKVKPKTLNGKFITGEMLLELCYSYTKAVNKGSVPSIKSAWSYVCQNECQRAISESATLYESDMKEHLEVAKEAKDIKILEQGEEVVREHSVSEFKKRAVGGDTEEFERILRQELTKKFGEIKRQFNTFCESIMEKQYEERLASIRRSIATKYSKFSDSINSQPTSFREDINQFRKECEKESPFFQGKQEWILEKCFNLSSKFAESSAITEKQESEANIKILEVRLHELESGFHQMKEEKEDEISRLKNKLSKLENERTEIITEARIFEEKLRKIENENKAKKSIEEMYQSQLDELVRDHEDQMNELSEK